MRRRVDIDKASIYSIVINAVQIVAVIAIALLVLITDIEERSVIFVEFIICLAAALVVWGAVVDISQALDARRVNEQSTMLEEAYAQLEALNVTLRAQRHDFMNHLQVVSSLIEMGEYHEAEEYIERVYGDIQSVSNILRTGNPAVNALLKVKLGESQKRGVLMELHIHSKWDRLPVQGWEMCRVLGNLIDNGLDALGSTLDPRLAITLGEEGDTYFFVVENNGPQVPESIRATLFVPGTTTKGDGRGMGLAICHRIMTENGGDIVLETGAQGTLFRGWLPRPQEALPREAEAGPVENQLPNNAPDGIIS